MSWTANHARRIVKEAQKFAGPSWYDMGPRQREALVSVGIVRLALAQHDEMVPVLSINKVAREALRIINPKETR
jgi:hypothetical protein